MKRSPYGKTLGRVLRYVSRYGFLIFLTLLLALLSVASSLYFPILIGRAIDCIAEPGKVDFDSVFMLTVRAAAVMAAGALAQWLMSLINNRITFNVARDVRNDIFAKICVLPLAYLDSHPRGETVSRMIADVDTFADGLLMGFTQLFTGIITIVGTLALMFVTDPLTALAVVVLTPVSLLVARSIAKRSYSLFGKQSETRGEQTVLIEELIGNQKTVKAFSREARATADFDEVNGRLGRCSLKATFLSSLTNPCTRFINSLVYAAVALSGAFGVVSGRMTVGVLSYFLSYANQYTKPFNEISGVITELQNALACAERVFALADETPQLPDKAGAASPDRLSGTVKLNNVYFSYSPDKKLITDFNLTVTPGERIAIVGPTGCGKTTLINLLMRFYDADSGSVMYDGTDVRDMTRDSLRKNIGMVLQETWLRAGTVRGNITMGKPDATDEEVIAAAKAAHAHSFIKRLPKGYDTVLSEDGAPLSQGQKQLLCIARVMLALPPMLILDEATSSIDTRTELMIQSAFAKMMKGRTSFVVAHRLSTIRESDLILVMRDGNVVEQGTHDSLLKAGGFYAKLYNSQFAN